MAKNKEKDDWENNDRFDEEIERLFVVETKEASKRKQEQGNEEPKTLNEQEVENYSHILYPIEFAIASCYVENSSITDKMLLKVITSFVKEYSGQHDVGSVVWKKTKIGNVVNANPTRSTTIAMESKLGKALKRAAIEGLQEGPITREEFTLCLRYVAYCIDNRSWIGGGRGYLDWISNWFGLLGGGKKQKFDAFYDELSQVIGIEQSFLKGQTLYEDEP